MKRASLIVLLLLFAGGLASAQLKGPDSRSISGQTMLSNKPNVFTAPQQMTGQLRIGPAAVAPSIPSSSFGSAPVLACAEGTAPTGVFGFDFLWCDQVTHGWMFINNNGVPVRAVGTTYGVNEFSISAGPQTFGNNVAPDNYPSGSSIGAWRAINNCHFVYLMVQNTFHAAPCGTPPFFNVYDGPVNVGTAAQASGTLQARGIATITKETLPIAAGDVFGLEVSTVGATCLTDEFIATADVACP